MKLFYFFCILKKLKEIYNSRKKIDPGSAFKEY